MARKKTGGLPDLKQVNAGCRFALKGEMSNSTKSMAMLCH